MKKKALNKKASVKKTSIKKNAASSSRNKKTPPVHSPKTAVPVKKNRLSRAEKEKYTDLLLTMREKIDRQIAFLADDSLKNPESDIPKDEGTEDFGRDFALNILGSEHNFKFEIDDALRRIKADTFGVCEHCSALIAKPRLAAIPFARTCVSCQSEMEKNKPRYQAFGGGTTESVRLNAASGAPNQDE